VIAVTGGEGRLGSELVKRGCIPISCDISNEEEVSQEIDRVAKLGVDTIINCAAYTRVDDAETVGYEDTILANLRGPGFLRRNWYGKLIHISTGFVFDGTKESMMYDEEDIPNPLSHYAMTKMAGEAAAQMRQPTLIVRTLDLFGGSAKPDFVTGVLNQLERGEHVNRPDLLYGNPTYVPALADALLSVAKTQLRGILNMAGKTVISRYEFAKLIAEIFGYDKNLVSTNSISGAAKRPLHAGLDVSRAVMAGLDLPSAEEGLLRFKESWDAQHGEPKT
jgi:dTDP-4-dehydrorhamnose reductase